MNLDEVQDCVGTVEIVSSPGVIRKRIFPKKKRSGSKGFDTGRVKERTLVWNVACNPAALNQEKVVEEEKVDMNFDLKCGNSSCFDELEWEDNVYTTDGCKPNYIRRPARLADIVIHEKTAKNSFEEGLLQLKRSRGLAAARSVMSEIDRYDIDSVRVSPVEDCYRLEYLPHTAHQFIPPRKFRHDERLVTNQRHNSAMFKLHDKMVNLAAPFMERLYKLEQMFTCQKKDVIVYMEILGSLSNPESDIPSHRELDDRSHQQDPLERLSEVMLAMPKKPQYYARGFITETVHDAYFNQCREQWIQYLRDVDKTACDLYSILRQRSQRKLIPVQMDIQNHLQEAADVEPNNILINIV